MVCLCVVAREGEKDYALSSAVLVAEEFSSAPPHERKRMTRINDTVGNRERLEDVDISI